MQDNTASPVAFSPSFFPAGQGLDYYRLQAASHGRTSALKVAVSLRELGLGHGLFALTTAIGAAEHARLAARAAILSLG